MTTSETSAIPAAAKSPEVCSACSHSWDSHDPLGERYCNATISSALTRGCICKK